MNKYLVWLLKRLFMMTSSNGNIFRVTGHLCGEFTPADFPAQRAVTGSFDVFFDLHPYKRLIKQWWCWWFEASLCPLWRHRNEMFIEDNSEHHDASQATVPYTRERRSGSGGRDCWKVIVEKYGCWYWYWLVYFNQSMFKVQEFVRFKPSPVYMPARILIRPKRALYHSHKMKRNKKAKKLPRQFTDIQTFKKIIQRCFHKDYETAGFKYKLKI